MKASEPSSEAVEGLELGVEVGQDNLGMDSVEEEDTKIPKLEEIGMSSI